MKVTRRDFIKNTLMAGGTLLFSPGPLKSALPHAADPEPAYAALEKQGQLAERIAKVYGILKNCRLCPRACGVDRLSGEIGFCRAPQQVMVYAAQPHFGEEISLTGLSGSGTIFFSHCNLRCIFCQNWSISHLGHGKMITDEELADLMIFLQDIGCHNINLVTPTHVMPHILNATRHACRRGLEIPLVYNTSGYERAEIVKLLDGIVDIYLPDLKYMDPVHADKYSAGASDYPETAKQAILEMHRQVGPHQVDQRGIAVRGLMIRHLVMPNRIAGTRRFVEWVAEFLPSHTYINIMAQYHVAYEAFEYPEIARGITVQEFLEAMSWAEASGLRNLDPRSIQLRDYYRKTSS